MSRSYESFKKYRVEAKSIEDFLQKYTKHKQHYSRGKEYAQIRIEAHQDYINKYGFTFITHHDSVTGEIVAYYI